MLGRLSRKRGNLPEPMRYPGKRFPRSASPPESDFFTWSDRQRVQRRARSRFASLSRSGLEVGMLGVLDIIQMMPAHLAVDAAGGKPKQPRGLRLIALFSAEHSFQQNPLAIAQRLRKTPPMSVQQVD